MVFGGFSVNISFQHWVTPQVVQVLWVFIVVSYLKTIEMIIGSPIIAAPSKIPIKRQSVFFIVVILNGFYSIVKGGMGIQ